MKISCLPYEGNTSKVLLDIIWRCIEIVCIYVSGFILPTSWVHLSCPECHHLRKNTTKTTASRFYSLHDAFLHLYSCINQNSYGSLADSFLCTNFIHYTYLEQWSKFYFAMLFKWKPFINVSSNYQIISKILIIGQKPLEWNLKT